MLFPASLPSTDPSLSPTFGREIPPRDYNVLTTRSRNAKEVGKYIVQIGLIKCISMLGIIHWDQPIKTVTCAEGPAGLSVKFTGNQLASQPQLLNKHIVWSVVAMWSWFEMTSNYYESTARLAGERGILGVGTVRQQFPLPDVPDTSDDDDTSMDSVKASAGLEVMNQSSAATWAVDASGSYPALVGNSTTSRSLSSPSSANTSNDTNTFVESIKALSVNDINPDIQLVFALIRPLTDTLCGPTDFNYMILDTLVFLAERDACTFVQPFRHYYPGHDFTLALLPTECEDCPYRKFFWNGIAGDVLVKMVMEMGHQSLQNTYRGTHVDVILQGHTLGYVAWFPGRDPKKFHAELDQVTEVTR